MAASIAGSLIRNAARAIQGKWSGLKFFGLGVERRALLQRASELEMGEEASTVVTHIPAKWISSERHTVKKFQQ